jgi:hypothetical protein
MDESSNGAEARERVERLKAEQTEEKAGASGKGKTSRKRVQRLDDFLAEFVPPDYILDGILQRGYLYSLTGKTGSGKSALAITLCLIIVATAFGGKLGPHDAVPGRIVYICKENPTDIQMRLKAMCFTLGIDPAIIGRDFLVIQHIDSIEKHWAGIARELEDYGETTLIVVDTSVALFTDDDENAGIPMHRHAKKMRSLTNVVGRPCVLVLCHPGKNPASPDDLLPRGGGPFVNEMDGNLTIWDVGGYISELHWRGKIRGPGFDKIAVRMVPLKTLEVVDTKGRILPTVMARYITPDEIAAISAAGAVQDEQVLVAMHRNPGGSLATWATALNWRLTADPKSVEPAKPDRNKVHRAIDRLFKNKLVAKDGNTFILTPAGAKRASDAEARNALATPEDTLQ